LRSTRTCTLSLRSIELRKNVARLFIAVHEADRD
jgi:hypothetical protein